jgi:riboflavin synthase|tara:strand:+ start:1117 stop:1704 length:588 start_codon:yes stop_codon:yes gene_type:complete
MFNGIIFNTGKIKSIVKKKKSFFIEIESKLKINSKDIGSSISCNGVCLTIVKIKHNSIFFDVSEETLKRSNFIFLKKNQLINLEASIKYGQKISGHFVQGHVDTTATVKKINFVDKTWLINLSLVDLKLKKFLVEKASISINGISLTISKVSKNFFDINVIPHTLKSTNLKCLKKKDIVNVELDIFGKYIYKYSN